MKNKLGFTYVQIGLVLIYQSEIKLAQATFLNTLDYGHIICVHAFCFLYTLLCHFSYLSNSQDLQTIPINCEPQLVSLELELSSVLFLGHVENLHRRLKLLKF